MTKSKTELKRRALLAVSNYGAHLTLFRNAVSAWAGLNASDTECLFVLSLQGMATPSELARHTGLTSGATTAMLDRLERAGLIERRPNPKDRRGSLIAPTPVSAEKMAGMVSIGATGASQVNRALFDKRTRAHCGCLGTIHGIMGTGARAPAKQSVVEKRLRVYIAPLKRRSVRQRQKM
ncbi:MarR family transcriptional regulator [Anaerolineae bacterium CFX7]|nr:MarR family transcriptional regulator [Anaerolineae bacterium CFX7]